MSSEQGLTGTSATLERGNVCLTQQLQNLTMIAQYVITQSNIIYYKVLT